MQLSLGDDSEDEAPPDPRAELNEYLSSKREEHKEGLVEWWGVSLLFISLQCPTNGLPLYTSTILAVTPPSPA